MAENKALSCCPSMKDLTDKFNQFNYRLNSLLATEKPLIHLSQNHEEKFSLGTGIVTHYKISCKLQSTPLKIRVSLTKGQNHSFLSIAMKRERPTKELCNKCFPLNFKENIFSYYGEREGEATFIHSYFYITIECEKDCAGTILVGFGNNRLKKQVVENNNTEEKIEEKNIRFLTHSSNTTNLDDLIKLVMENQPRVKTAVPIVMRPISRKDPIVLKSHRANVIMLRDKLEESEIQKRFTIIHRHEINNLFEQIVARKIEERKNLTSSIQSLVVMIKLTKLFTKLYLRFGEELKKHLEVQHRIQCTIKISLFFKSKICHKEGGYKGSIKNHNAAYFFIQSNLYSGITLTHQQLKRIAYDRSAEAVGEVFKALYYERRFKKKADQYISRRIFLFYSTKKLVEMIQKSWRCKMRLDATRKSVLFKMWDALFKKLKKEYNNMGKKYATTATRLKNLTDEIRDKLLTDYYKNAKLKYMKDLKKFLRQKKAKESHTLNILARFSKGNTNNCDELMNKIEEEKKLEQKYAGKGAISKAAIRTSIAINLTRKNTIRLPIQQAKQASPHENKSLEAATSPRQNTVPAFKYKPTNEDMIKMILKAADDSAFF